MNLVKNYNPNYIVSKDWVSAKGYHWVESWLFSTNCQNISILYGMFSLFSGLVGLSLSILMRIELSSPNPQILMHNGQLWNVLITAHALFMVFFLVMPITMGALGNYLVPLMIGSNDTAFPRINNLAFVILIPSMLFAVLSCLIDEGPGTGWTLNRIWCSKILLDAEKTFSFLWRLINYSFYIKIVKIFINISLSACICCNMHQRLSKSYKIWLIINRLLENLFIKNKLNVIRLLNKNIFIHKNNFNKRNYNYSTLEILKKNKYILPNKTPFNFNEYLVGLIDKVGIFSIYLNKENKKIIFKFQITLKNNDLQLLYYLKSQLNCGIVLKTTTNCTFVVHKKEHLINIILPIFDKYPLLTSKKVDYLKFKMALLHNCNTSITQTEKIEIISKIKNIKFYQFPNFNTFISKSWLIGFINVERSFYYTTKKTGSIVHSFEISQKLDKWLLEDISKILNFKNKISYNKKNQLYKINTINSSTIKFIINYFSTDNNKSFFKGIKSYEFSIWKKSFFKYRKNYQKLKEIFKNLRDKTI